MASSVADALVMVRGRIAAAAAAAVSLGVRPGGGFSALNEGMPSINNHTIPGCETATSGGRIEN